jgi:hypothetical protein
VPYPLGGGEVGDRLAGLQSSQLAGQAGGLQGELVALLQDEAQLLDQSPELLVVGDLSPNPKHERTISYKCSTGNV